MWLYDFRAKFFHIIQGYYLLRKQEMGRWLMAIRVHIPGKIMSNSLMNTPLINSKIHILCFKGMCLKNLQGCPMAHPKLTRRPSANKIMFFPFLSVNLSTWGLMLTFFVQFSSIHLTSISQSKWPGMFNFCYIILNSGPFLSKTQLILWSIFHEYILK